ncbi:MAG: BlaI/MecI/CopY family transcriptional regulator [Pirellulales bacterium]|nr:BlaI/MecI/CopY family transcriptional regulator [Pirellulales bacterium]
MPRPKQPHPTPGELEVLKILWDGGPATVREVMEVLNRRRRRAYTSVMSLLEVMTEKRLLRRRPAGRAYLYTPAVDQQKTLGRIVEDVVGRVFEGSAAALMAHLLGRSDTTPEELEAIQKLIEQHQA